MEIIKEYTAKFNMFGDTEKSEKNVNETSPDSKKNLHLIILQVGAMVTTSRDLKSSLRLYRRQQTQL